MLSVLSLFSVKSGDSVVGVTQEKLISSSSAAVTNEVESLPDCPRSVSRAS